MKSKLRNGFFGAIRTIRLYDGTMVSVTGDQIVFNRGDKSFNCQMSREDLCSFVEEVTNAHNK